jgi:hypothetical protein
MDSRPGDEMLLLAAAERDIGAFCTFYERHAGWLAIRLAQRCNDRFGDHDAASGTSVFDAHRALGFALAATAVVMFVLDVITRPGVLPDGMSRRWGA